jgi:hypothetical protein
VRKKKGLFWEKNLWKGEACSRTVKNALISGYAGRKSSIKK